MERIIRYSRKNYGSRMEGDFEEPLSIFLYDIPRLMPCWIFPPLHLLDIVIRKGEAGGSMSPKFIWEPFELSEQEYQAILPKILDPEFPEMWDKLWRLIFPAKLDPEFDHFEDLLEWKSAILGKYVLKSLEEREAELAKRFEEVRIRQQARLKQRNAD